MVKIDSFVNKKGGWGNYNFPSAEATPDEKLSKTWCTQFASAIYSLYLQGLCAINFTDLNGYERLRAYAAGNQNPVQYQDILDPKEATVIGEGVANNQNPGAVTQWARKGWMNINWGICKIAPKFLTYVLGLAEEIEHDVFADGIDEKSSQAREMEKWRLWVEMQYGEQIADIAASAGVEMSKPDYIPETQQELEMFSQMGGFKLKSEIAIESAISYTLWLSRYKEVKRKVIADYVTLGMGGTKDYVDPNTQKVMVRYVNPARGVFPYSVDNDYRNMPFGGEFVTYTIAELRALNKPDGSKMFTDEELHGIAVQYVGILGNPMSLASTNFSYYAGLNSNYTQYDWYQFNICVLDCEFKSDDYKYTTTKINEDGTKEVRASKFGKVRNSDTKKTTTTKTLMVYKCKWIVGTDLAWDYGHQFDIPRPTPSECSLSFHFSRIQGPSIVDMMITYLDQFQLAYLRAQNHIAMSPAAGISMDFGTMSNINIGGKNGVLTPRDLIKLRMQTGVLLYAATTHRSYMPTATNYKPIQELEGGAGRALDEDIKMMDLAINGIQEITGINRVASAQNPTGEDLVGVSQIALQATQTTLKPLFSQYLSMKERLCQNLTLRVQLIVRTQKYYDGYFRALGQPITQTLKIGSEINNAMYNIRIEVRPSAEEKAKINEAATISMQAGRNGQPGITMSDYLTINRFIQQGMLKYAEAYLAYRENVATKQAAEQAKANSQQQSDAMLALEQEKAKTAQMVTNLETTKEVTVINAQLEADLKKLALEHSNKMEEIQLTLSGQVEQTQMNTHAKVIDTVIGNKTKKEIADQNTITEHNYLDLEHRKIDEQPKTVPVKK